MNDWEAALVAYIVAMIVAETEAAPVAVALSWGFAIFMVIDQIGTGGQTLGTLVQAVKGSAAAPAQAPSTQPQSPLPNQMIPGTAHLCFDITTGRTYQC